MGRENGPKSQDDVLQVILNQSPSQNSKKYFNKLDNIVFMKPFH